MVTSSAFRRKLPSEILPDNLRPVGPGTCKRAGPNSTDVAFVVAVKVRVSGERIFHVGRHGSHQKGNPPSGVPLIFVNIIISLLFNFRSIFCWKFFWAPGQHFVGWREECFGNQRNLRIDLVQCRTKVIDLLGCHGS